MNLKVIKPFGKEIEANALKISLCDKNPEIAQALAKAFEGVKNVEVLCGNVLNLSGDALVTPGNSFGDMSGGLDKVIDDFFQGHTQTKIQDAIAYYYFGEQPIGTAMILSLDNQQFTNIIYAPTMRVPGNIKDSINAYLAMRAILVAVLQHNEKQKPIKRLIVPSLGTGIGGMYYQVAAEQMRMAYENVINEGWKNVAIPAMAPYAGGVKWSFKP